jgi:hypothetical protein
VLARRARRRFAEAVKGYLVLPPIVGDMSEGREGIEVNGTGVGGSDSGVRAGDAGKGWKVPPPLIVLCLPLDLAFLGLRLAFVPFSDVRAYRLAQPLTQARDRLGLLLVGPLCYLLGTVGRIVSQGDSV